MHMTEQFDGAAGHAALATGNPSPGEEVRRPTKRCAASTWKSIVGGIFAFFGPNSAGKTTTVESLEGSASALQATSP
jgi:flagellar biosynthesis GTPase FlhF